MNYKEYGKENSDVIMLLHGGGLSWWNYREVAERLQDKYHVILPILDGHAGSDRRFTSIEDNAKEIIDYIDENHDGKVLMMGGLSFGAQILVEILSERNDICRHAMIESAMVIPSAFTNAMIKPVFGSSYGLIKQRWFAKLQFRSMHMKADLFEEYYRDTCGISEKDMIAFLQANTAYGAKESLHSCLADVHIYIGQKENKGMKNSALKIQEMIPGSSLTVMPGMYHGEFSINHADEYVREAERILSEEYFDICTDDGRTTGRTVARSIAHRDGIKHRTVHIWITRMEDGRRQVLLQKRSMQKDSFPGLYDTSSAGHMQAGSEPLESAIRELEEELGITASPEQLKFAGNCHIKYDMEFHGSVFRDDEVVFLYVYDAPVDIKDIVIQEEELEAVEWFDLEEVYDECSRGIRNRFCVPIQGLELLRTMFDELPAPKK